MASAQKNQRKPNVATTEIRRKPISGASTAAPLLNTDKATHAPDGWPTSPKCVKSPLFATISNSAFDVVLLACSAAFLAFALIVNHYDQASTAEHPDAKSMLVDATKYVRLSISGPTVFPILFASVIGRATHAILRWRLEQGERVGILDTLATSTSLTSTVTSQFQLRMISVLGVILVAIWAFSPIGGQASIRQMTIGTKLVTQPASFWNMVHNGYVNILMSSGNMQGYMTVNTLFAGALIAPWKTRMSPLDTWGNVKIPKVEHYEGTSKPDKEGWYSTSPDDNDLAVYTSFVGIPIDGNKANSSTTNYDMRIQTPYLSLNCTPFNGSRENWGQDRFPGSVQMAGTGAFIFWLEDQKNRSTTVLQDLRPFLFTYVPDLGPNVTLVPCRVSSTYVETEISCVANSTCRATKVRRSQLDHLPPAWTVLDQWRDAWPYLMEGFMSSIPGYLNQSGISLLDKYLADPFLPTNESIFEPAQKSLSAKEYSDRFGQFLNSYFTCMTGIFALTGGINNDTSYFWDTNLTYTPPHQAGTQMRLDFGVSYNWTGDSSLSRAWPSEGTKSIHTEIFVAHRNWVILLSVASIVLVISSLVSPFVHVFFAKGPDVAMNISSLTTRHNPNILLPPSGTSLDAADRAKLLRDLRVRFGDVDGNAEVGRLAVGSYSAERSSIARVRKGRLYE